MVSLHAVLNSKVYNKNLPSALYVGMTACRFAELVQNALALVSLPLAEDVSQTRNFAGVLLVAGLQLDQLGANKREQFLLYTAFVD